MVQLPSLLLIGAQKAGTSAVADWLFDGGFRRPHVFGDEPEYYCKETHFFDIDWRFHQGLDFYARRFRDDGTGGPALDATPDTLQFAVRVRDIYERAGGNQADTVKLIVILRDPIARELSLYNHLAYDCRHLEPSHLSGWHKQVTNADGSVMSFDEFVSCVCMPALSLDDASSHDWKRPGRSSRHGLYARYLQEWFDLFSRRDQILVLSYQELCHNPGKLQDRIRDFVGLPIPGIIRKANANDSHFKVVRPSPEAKQRLASVLEPHNQRLHRLLESRPGPPMEERPFPRFNMCENP
jgi:hypothetical protein